MGTERTQRSSVEQPGPNAPHGDVVSCHVCGRRNRVPVAATGRPRCGECHSDLPWLVDVDERRFGDAVDAPGLVLVDFWAPWCGPCRSIAPILEHLAERYAGRLKVVKLNVDGAPTIARQYRAQSIPLLVAMRDGAEIDRVVGAHPEHHLDALVRRHLVD